jgi:hypothetical protein
MIYSDSMMIEGVCLVIWVMGFRVSYNMGNGFQGVL